MMEVSLDKLETDGRWEKGWGNGRRTPRDDACASRALLPADAVSVARGAAVLAVAAALTDAGPARSRWWTAAKAVVRDETGAR